MISFTTLHKMYQEPALVQITKGHTVVGYSFKNTGGAICYISNKSVPGSDVWELYPGDSWVSVIPGCLDVSQYYIDFKQNDSPCQDGNVSRCSVMSFVKM